MALSLVTGPASEPVTLADAKRQCRIDDVLIDEDDLITALIRAAREYVEVATRRALITQTWDYKLDAFPCDTIELPLAPVTSVTSISYVDTAGSPQTWSSALYTTEFPVGPQAVRARIEPAYGEYYPSTRTVINAVTVRFVAGYGTTAATVPEGLRHAIKLLVGHWYRQREPVHLGPMVSVVPLTIDSVIWPFKSF